MAQWLSSLVALPEEDVIVFSSEISISCVFGNVDRVSLCIALVGLEHTVILLLLPLKYQGYRCVPCLSFCLIH